MKGDAMTGVIVIVILAAVVAVSLAVFSSTGRFGGGTGSTNIGNYTGGYYGEGVDGGGGGFDGGGGGGGDGGGGGGC